MRLRTPNSRQVVERVLQNQLSPEGERLEVLRQILAELAASSRSGQN